MKCMRVHLSGLVRSPMDPNVSPIDTSSNGRNCSTHIYIYIHGYILSISSAVVEAT
jgi:hypothetical protein